MALNAVDSSASGFTSLVAGDVFVLTTILAFSSHVTLFEYKSSQNNLTGFTPLVCLESTSFAAVQKNKRIKHFRLGPKWIFRASFTHDARSKSNFTNAYSSVVSDKLILHMKTRYSQWYPTIRIISIIGPSFEISNYLLNFSLTHRITPILNAFFHKLN
jgi:hypothetical protein